MNRSAPFFFSLVFALAVGAADAAAPSGNSFSTAANAGAGELTIFAASSLQETFRALADAFGKAHGTAIHLSFAGSQELRTQIEQGAQADLFASADRRHADALEKAGLLQPAKTFAYNGLTIVVPKGNPAGVHALADLARLPHIVIGAHEVPVGAYAEKLFALAEEKTPSLRGELEKRISSRELNVRQVLAKVALGEADAGIVYRTDAQAMSSQVDAVALPPEFELRTEDLIGVVVRAKNPQAANAFIDFLLSAAGANELRARGFIPAIAP